MQPDHRGLGLVEKKRAHRFSHIGVGIIGTIIFTSSYLKTSAQTLSKVAKTQTISRSAMWQRVPDGPDLDRESCDIQLSSAGDFPGMPPRLEVQDEAFMRQ